MHKVRMTSVLIALLFAAPLALPPRRAEAATSLPLKIQSVVISNGHLVAIGSLGNQLFAAPLNLTAQQATPCPILNLTLGPLDLNLLGLLVHLDDCAGGPVIVTITAIPSTEVGGGLLGDLLCSLANLLNNPPAILSTLTTAINGL